MTNLNALRIFVGLSVVTVSTAISSYPQGQKSTALANQKCALLVNVIDASDPSIKVGGASVHIKKSGSSASIRPTLVKGLYLFSPLPGGKLSIGVSKSGYASSAQEYELECTEFASVLEIGIERKFALKMVPIPQAASPRYKKGEPFAYMDTTPVPELRAVDPITVSGNSVEEGPPSPSRVPPKIISGGVVNGKATTLVKPPYPAAARAVQASGAVTVQVTIDEQGNVISASAVSGHPLLRAAAVEAARASKFEKVLLLGQAVKVSGIVIYTFVP